MVAAAAQAQLLRITTIPRHRTAGTAVAETGKEAIAVVLAAAVTVVTVINGIDP
jgi:hypothetical protein